MNIAFVARHYYPFVGGVETLVRMVAHELCRRNHKVTVIATNFKSEKVSARMAPLADSLLIPHFDSYEDGPVRVIALTPNILERLQMLPIACRSAPRIQRYHYDSLLTAGYRWYRQVFLPRLQTAMSDADLAHSFAFDYLGWCSREAASALSIPFVCTPFVHPGQWGDNRPNIDYYKKCDAVIALLESDKEYLQSLGVRPDRIPIVGVAPELPLTCDSQGFRQRHGLEDVPFVLYVGRMMEQKGAKSILAACHQVWQVLPETRFVFIGPHQAESAAWFTNLDQRVLYLGKVELDEKAAALAACNIFCMPSMSEILPTAYLEAWSYSKPVIGGLAPGLFKLVEGNGAGLCVEQNPDSIANIIIELLGDPDKAKKMGENGHRLLQEKYSKDAVTTAHEDIYTRLLNEQT